MCFLQRGLISIKGNTRKSIILFLLLLTLGIMMSGAIIVNQATANTKQNVINNMQPSAIIGLDHEGIMQYNHAREMEGDWTMAEPAPLTTELISRVGALPYVAHYEYFVMGYFFVPYLESYEPVLNGHPMHAQGMSGWLGDLGWRYDLRGVHSPNFLDLEQGVIEIIAGRNFSEYEIHSSSQVALVSEAYATLNQLTVGSIITVENVVFHPMKIPFVPDWNRANTLAYERYDIEIIGIFKTPTIGIQGGEATGQPPWDLLGQMDIFGNRIYTPSGFVERAKEFSARIAAENPVEDIDRECEMTANMQRMSQGMARGFDQMRLETFFVLHDPSYIIPFRETVQEMLPEFYIVAIAENNFDEIIAALDTLDSLASMILYMTIVAMILIISLLIVLFLRDRKHEMGIYLSVGEKRSKIIAQMAVEVLVVAFLAFSLSIFIGNHLAGHVGELMLLNDLVAIAEQGAGVQMFDLFFRQGLTGELTVQTIANSYNITLGFVTVLTFLGVGLGTVLLATIAPGLYIMRLNPKKIMM